MAKISIIVPVYNVEDFLDNMLNSVLTQDYRDFEMILVNDGSTDKSAEICERFAQQDKRIKVINCPNGGSGLARNIGIANATGEFAYFPDADDILVSGALEIMAKEIDEVDADLYVFGYSEGDRSGNIINHRYYADDVLEGQEVREKYLKHYQKGQYYLQGAPWNKLFKMSNIKNNDLQFPTLRRHQDEVFIMRFVNTVKNVRFVNANIYHYYTNALEDQWRKFPSNYFDIRTKVMQFQHEIIFPWNPENIYIRNFLDVSYLLGVIECFKYSYSKRWGFDKDKRTNYIKNCLTHEEVIKSLNNLKHTSNKQINVAMKWKYPKVLIFRMLLILMRFKKARALKIITLLRLKLAIYK